MTLEATFNETPRRNSSNYELWTARLQESSQQGIIRMSEYGDSLIARPLGFVNSTATQEFVCPFCHQVFNSGVVFYNHQQIQHSNQELVLPSLPPLPLSVQRILQQQQQQQQQQFQLQQQYQMLLQLQQQQQQKLATQPCLYPLAHNSLLPWTFPTMFSSTSGETLPLQLVPNGALAFDWSAPPFIDVAQNQATTPAQSLMAASAPVFNNNGMTLPRSLSSELGNSVNFTNLSAGSALMTNFNTVNTNHKAQQTSANSSQANNRSVNRHLTPCKTSSPPNTFANGSARAHICNVCKKAFARTQDRNRHMRVHSGEKPFACEVQHCGRAFSQSGHLRRHMRVHSESQPFVCEIGNCQKRFSEIGGLRSHQLIHSGIRPYSCHRCNKQFSRSGDLRAHYRTHSGERPFACSHADCGKSFTTLSNLRRHARVHCESESGPTGSSTTPVMNSDDSEDLDEANLSHNLDHEEEEQEEGNGEEEESHDQQTDSPVNQDSLQSNDLSTHLNSSLGKKQTMVPDPLSLPFETTAIETRIEVSTTPSEPVFNAQLSSSSIIDSSSVTSVSQLLNTQSE